MVFANHSEESPNEGIADGIMSRCIALYPSLTKGFEIISHNVGLRPSRVEGLRVEIETASML